MKQTLHIALVACSIIVAIVLAEIGLRVIGVGAPPAFASHPQYGYLMKPSQWVSTRGIAFQINSAGLRGTDFTPQKPPGTFRLVFVGDSITYGGGSIADANLFTNRVAAALQVARGQTVEIINLSAPGWGIENMVGYINMNGVYDADVVLWVLPECDFRRPKMSLEENHFPTVQPWSRLFYIAYTAIIQFKSWQKDVVSANDETLFKSNVDLLIETLQKLMLDHSRVGLVVLPSEEQTESYELDLVAIRTAARVRSIAVLDVTHTFQIHRTEGLYMDGAHLSSSGHKVMAEAITKFLHESLAPTTVMQSSLGH